MSWNRPESKQAYRKYFCRPETSKGVRTIEKTSQKWLKEAKTAPYHSQYVPDKVNDDHREEPNSQIEIIVTKSRKTIDSFSKAGKSKFETDLDD